MTEHGHERHEPRATRNQQQRPTVLHSPVEVAADGAAQLELVANPKLLGQVWRDLTVVDSLDRQGNRLLLRRGGDRVGALGLVAVLGGKADIDVLTGDVPAPTRHIEQDGPGVSRLLDQAADRCEPPSDWQWSHAQSPW